MSNKEEIKEKIKEWQFAECPTETKEPFFWKWNKHGLEILSCGIDELLEVQKEELLKKIEEKSFVEDLTEDKMIRLEDIKNLIK